MAYADRCRQITTTTGPDTLLLGAPVLRNRALAQGYAIGDQLYYCVEHTQLDEWEIGRGVLVDATHLTRDVVLSSSNDNQIVSFSAGEKHVFGTIPASALGALASPEAAAVAAVADPDAAYLSMRVGAQMVQIKITDFLTALGTSDVQLANASALADGNALVITQDGDSSVQTTLGALRTFLAGASTPADTVAPVLTSASGTAAGTTTATGNVTTNEANGTLYCLASTSSTATATAVKGSSLSQAITSTGAKTFNITGLLASTLYYLHFLHRDAAGNDSAVVSASFTTLAENAPATVPGAPTIGTAAAGDGYVDVVFTAPASNGGSAITSYTATLSTGESNTGTASPIRVTAANGTARTATVTATNSVGTGAASAASNSVTPQAATAYTITGYSGNTVKETYDASALGTTSGRKSILNGSFSSGQGYFSISPTPASAQSGWGESPTTPPAVITAADNLGASGAGGNNQFLNGFVAMSKPSAWQNTSRLWVPVGTDPTKRWYFWIWPVNGTPYCFNPSGMTVTGA